MKEMHVEKCINSTFRGTFTVLVPTFPFKQRYYDIMWTTIMLKVYVLMMAIAK